MGQVCSSSKDTDIIDSIGDDTCHIVHHILRDPSDKELDKVQMRATHIQEFDCTFTKALAWLNELIDIHNQLVFAQENVKEAAAILYGAPQIVLKRRAVMEMDGIDMYLATGDGIPIEKQALEALFHQELSLEHAYTTTKVCLDELNEALRRADQAHDSNLNSTRWNIVHGRLQIIESGDVDGKIEDMNRALFRLRKELQMMFNIIKLSQAIRAFVSKELVKLYPEILQIYIESDLEDGIIRVMMKSKEKNELDVLTLQDEVKDGLSLEGIQLRDEIFQLLENMKNAMIYVPELKKRLDRLRTQALEFPSRTSDALAHAGLPPDESEPILEVVHKNIHDLDGVQMLARSTIAMIQHIIRELKNGFHLRNGHAHVVAQQAASQTVVGPAAAAS